MLQSFFTFEGKGTMIFLMSCKKLFGDDAKMIGWGSATLNPRIGTIAREWNTDIVCGEVAFVR